MPPRRKQKPAKPPGQSEQTAKQQVPNWPLLAPLIPAVDLSLQTRLQGQILLIQSLFTSTLCKNYVSFLSSLPLSTTPGNPRRGEAVRVNDRFQIEDKVFAKMLWEQTALQYLIESFEEPTIFGGKVLGLNPNIRVYRYRPGQFFAAHYDESNTLQFGEDKVPAKTTWTLLIYLTSCEGGETAFYLPSTKSGEKTPAPIMVSPEVGLGLLHKHGDDCLPHEGREVTSGEKWVLRSDLVVER